MARAKKPQPEPEPEYFLHSGMRQWGTCVLVRQTKDQRTYLFTDGKQRTFKEEFAWLNFVDAPPPGEEDRIRLLRGLVAGGSATPKALHLELEAEIRARPRDRDPYLVYADWLQGREDPRGALITLQHQLQQAPGDKKLRAAEKSLLREHGDYLLPAVLVPLLPARPSSDPLARTELAWHMGFLERVRLARKRAGEDDLPMPEIVAGLLEHPSSQFLRGLTLGPLGGHTTTSYADAIAAVARRERPFLEELVIGDVDPLDLPFTTTGSLSPILSALPALRSLDVRTATLRLDVNVKHATLRELCVVTTSLSAATLRRLVTARLPELERLELTCEGLHLGSGELAPLLDAAGVPNLRRLAIRGSRGTRALLDAIVTSKLGARLESLVIERGDLDDRDLALVIHARRPALEKLRELEISGSRLTEAGRARLVELAPARDVPAATTTTPEITAADVGELAPDRESVKAARTVARPSRWHSLGRDAERVWGQYKGGSLYFVSTRFDGNKASCSCASYKEPCKHVLGLLLIVASGHTIETRPVPPSVRRNTPDRPRPAT